ncbi:glycosyltransferase [Mycobacterium tuberculosis]|nr:glycosyltransferase [Mycobacterium tuberculosis]
MTTQQALVAGVPVIGVAGNLDQHLNMEAVVPSDETALDSRSMWRMLCASCRRTGPGHGWPASYFDLKK